MCFEERYKIPNASDDDTITNVWNLIALERNENLLWLKFMPS